MRLVECDNCGKIEEEEKAYKNKEPHWYYHHDNELDACSLECHVENSKEMELDQ